MAENSVEAIEQRLDEHDADARSWLNTITPTDVRLLLTELAAVKAELKRKDALVADVLAKTGRAVERLVADGRSANIDEAQMFNALDALRAFYAALATPKPSERPKDTRCYCDSHGHQTTEHPKRDCIVVGCCYGKPKPTSAEPQCLCDWHEGILRRKCYACQGAPEAGT